MSCEHLICARCAGPVVEGRCPTCRAARAEVHHPFGAGTPQLVALLLLLVAIATVVAAHLG